MLGPILSGERVRMVPPTPEMLPAYLRWFSDTEVTRYLGHATPLSLAEEQEWFDRTARSKDDVVWAIMVGDKLIGASGIHRIDWRNRRAITGVMLGEKDEWSKGYATEAHALRTRYAFEELGLEKLMSEAFIENRGSIRALEKTGYRQYGTARHHIFREGRWHDFWLGELLRDEWLEARATTGAR
jgi:RimJ/RimL family protein N-acetyltransferase